MRQSLINYRARAARGLNEQAGYKSEFAGVTVKSVRANFGPGGPFLLADLVPSRRILPPLPSVIECIKKITSKFSLCRSKNENKC